MTLRRTLMVAIFLGLFSYANTSPVITNAGATGSQGDFASEILLGSGRPEENVQPLYEFISQVKNGQAEVLVGVYATGLFAYPVIQQPAEDPAFVSSLEDTLTQFRMANAFGTTGILAHNTLAGDSFSSLQENQQVALVYGSGAVSEYTVKSIRRFQALSPASPFSDFMDADHPGTVISSSQLFETIYASNQRQVVFQTCIANGPVSSWGRLFVTAVPVVTQGKTPLSVRFIQ